MYRRIELIDHPKTSSAMYISASAMVKSGLPSQDFKKCTRTWHRPKYFFTEYGWKKCGHAIVSDIRSQGFTAKIISLKEKDPKIKIIYKDAWQVAIVFGGKDKRVDIDKCH